MKKLLTALLALAMLLALSACGPKGDLTFKNELRSEVHSVYFSPSSSSSWGDRWNSDHIRSGRSAYVNFADLSGDGAGTSYDIGVVDENNMNYDAYGIILNVGDTVTLTGSSSSAKYVITSSNGSSTEYECTVYEGSSN